MTVLGIGIIYLFTDIDIVYFLSSTLKVSAHLRAVTS